MYSWKQDGISVKVVLDKRYLRNNGAYPIRIRVIYKRILKEFNTGIEATPLEWEKIKSSKAKAFLGIQQHIKERFEMIVQITERLSEKVVMRLNIRINFSEEFVSSLYSIFSHASKSITKFRST